MLSNGVHLCMQELGGITCFEIASEAIFGPKQPPGA